MRDDLSGLRALFRVAQKRSFRAAAAEMRVTPSAVSQTIRALEERLGVRLLQRTGYTDVFKPILARFIAAYPDVRVDLSLDEALTDIVTGGFDAGLRLGESLDREMVAVRVSADQRLVVV